MFNLLILVLLVYISHKLYRQEALMKEQNELIESLQEMQAHCKQHVKRLEKLYDSISKDK